MTNKYNKKIVNHKYSCLSFTQFNGWLFLCKCICRNVHFFNMLQELTSTYIYIYIYIYIYKRTYLK